MKKVILIYSNENITVANKLKMALNGHATVETFELSNTNELKSLGSTILNNTASPVLLIISDNFLKSEVCMNNAMYIVQSIGNQKRLIPVTTDGVYRNVAGELSYVHTSFDRVSQVIQYMNFWQERYLQMRSQKTGVGESDTAEKTKLVRTISSEVGELLRYLRTMEYYPFDQIEATKYNTLYRLLDLDFAATLSVEKKADKPVTSVISQDNIYIPNTVSVKEAIKETLLEKKPVLEMETVSAKAHISDSSNGKSKAPIVIEKPESIFQKESMITIADIIPNQKTKEVIEEKKPETITSNVKPPLTLEALIESIKKETALPVDIENKPFAVKELSRNIEDKTITTIIHPLTEIGVVPSNDAPNETIFTELIAAPDFETRIIPVKDTPVNIQSEPKLSVAEEKSESECEQLIAPVSTETQIVENHPVTPIPEEKNNVTQVPFIENSFVTEGETIKNISYSEISSEVKPEKEKSFDNKPVLVTELEHLKSTIAIQPDNNDLRYQYASLLVENYQFDEATEQLEMILQNDRKHVDSYILLAYIAEQNRDYSLSLNSLEKVMLLQPNYPGIFYKLGTLTQTHFPNQPKKALYYYKESLANEPNFAGAYFAYAQLLANNGGDPEEVKTCYEHTVELNPAHAQAHLELAKFYAHRGDKKTAASFYQKAIAADKNLKSKEYDKTFYYEEPKKIVYRDNGFTVLITGATSGIGKAAATLFAQHGYRLILTGRRADRLAAIKSELEDTHSNRILTLEFDVRDLDSVHDAIETLNTEWQNIDILLNNAGLASGLSPIHEGDVRDWEKMIDTNIKGLLYVTRAVTPRMVARRKGHVINICSTAGKEIYPSGNVYVATKHAVDALTRAMRLDLFKHNVRVSQVAPGMVEDTEFSLVRFHGDVEKAKIYEDIKPLNAGDVADAIYYIATRPDHVNIQDLVVMSVQQGSANHFDRSGRNDR